MFVYNVYLHLVDVNGTDDTASTVKYKMNIPLGFSREFILSISRDNAFRYFLRTSKPVRHTHVQALRIKCLVTFFVRTLINLRSCTHLKVTVQHTLIGHTHSKQFFYNSRECVSLNRFCADISNENF